MGESTRGTAFTVDGGAGGDIVGETARGASVHVGVGGSVDVVDEITGVVIGGVGVRAGMDTFWEPERGATVQVGVDTAGESPFADPSIAANMILGGDGARTGSVTGLVPVLLTGELVPVSIMCTSPDTALAEGNMREAKKDAGAS